MLTQQKAMDVLGARSCKIYLTFSLLETLDCLVSTKIHSAKQIQSTVKCDTECVPLTQTCLVSREMPDSPLKAHQTHFYDNQIQAKQLTIIRYYKI